MPYYGSFAEGDPGLFGSIFKKLKKIKLGRIVGGLARATTTGGVLGALGFRPGSPAKGVVSKTQEVRAAMAGSATPVTVSVAAPLARRAKKARATFRVTGTGAARRVKAESSFSRRRRLGLI